MLSFERTNQPILRKLPDGGTEGQKDGQTLIHKTLPAMTGGPTSTNALDHI